jgi:hypothetical protein
MIEELEVGSSCSIMGRMGTPGRKEIARKTKT